MSTGPRGEATRPVRGASTVEYALLACLIGGGLVLAVVELGDSVAQMFHCTTSRLNHPTTPCSMFGPPADPGSSSGGDPGSDGAGSGGTGDPAGPSNPGPTGTGTDPGPTDTAPTGPSPTSSTASPTPTGGSPATTTSP